MSNHCAKCNGLIIQDYCLVTTAWFSKCIQCGARPDSPRRDPEPHHLSKERVSTLTVCACGEPKVEWRMYCRICSNKKLNKEQRRKLRERNGTVKRKEVQA